MTVALFCGSRKWVDVEPIRKVIEKLPEGSIVIHGDQTGADLIADTEAKRLGFDVIAIPADWETFELKAGPIRNEEMLKRLKAAAKFGQPVRAHAFHSHPKLGKGTHDMVVRCLKSRVRVDVFLSCEIGITRVSGNNICDECDVEYWRHPTITSIVDSQGQPFLELSCDGRFLKL